MDNNKSLVFAIIFVVVLGIIFFTINGLSGNNYSNRRSSSGGQSIGYCSVCGKKTSLTIDGRFYCFDHYNQRLFD